MNNYEANERRRVNIMKKSIEQLIRYDYQHKKSSVSHLKEESKNDIWKVSLEEYLDNLCNKLKEHVNSQNLIKIICEIEISLSDRL